MTNIIPINTDDLAIITDQGAQLDSYGQALLVGVYSDLCRYRDGEQDQRRATELAGIVKRLGKLVERYEP